MHEQKEQIEEVSLKDLFVPFTTAKAIGFIVIIGAVVFFNGLFNGFVGDDLPQITQNYAVQSLSNIPLFFLGSTFYNAGSAQLGGVYYKPLLDTFFALIHVFSGNNAFFFHFIQILFYLINSCLCFLVLKYFFSKKLAFVLSLIFLVHPINSEVAFYISDMQDIFFLFFGMLTILVIQKYHSNKSLIMASILLFLSLLSKETGILF